MCTYVLFVMLFFVCRGRLKHGRHFTFKSSVDCTAVTLVVPSVIGAFANAEQPYAVQGSWLQILLTEDLISEMTVCMEELCTAEGVSAACNSSAHHTLMGTFPSSQPDTPVLALPVDSAKDIHVAATEDVHYTFAGRTVTNTAQYL